MSVVDADAIGTEGQRDLKYRKFNNRTVRKHDTMVMQDDDLKFARTNFQLSRRTNTGSIFKGNGF